MAYQVLCVSIVRTLLESDIMDRNVEKDDRDILEILRAELAFIQKGGYGRSVRTPWKQTSIFQDSLSCINHGDPERHLPCSECRLIGFVSPEECSATIPCHQIPLNTAGETIEMLEERGDVQRLEETVKEWLKTSIARIEGQRSGEGLVR